MTGRVKKEYCLGYSSQVVTPFIPETGIARAEGKM